MISVSAFDRRPGASYLDIHISCCRADNGVRELDGVVASGD